MFFSGKQNVSLVHAAPELFWRTIYHVYELPVIEEEAAAASGV
jgi:hypothetical protein